MNRLETNYGNERIRIINARISEREMRLVRAHCLKHGLTISELIRNQVFDIIEKKLIIKDAPDG